MSDRLYQTVRIGLCTARETLPRDVRVIGGASWQVAQARWLMRYGPHQGRRDGPRRRGARLSRTAYPGSYVKATSIQSARPVNCQ